ncbi:MAG: hypothetical protein Q8O13_05175 [Candidatus Omnitrophota bacterium]|nr:hypothetical protein [Candidatus Omnitrophota bacterium]
MKKFFLPETVYIYHENLREIDFKKLSKFITKTFGKIKVKVIHLKSQIIKTRGIVFDLLNTHKAFNKISASKGKTTCDIVLTDRLIATEDEFKRLHLRAAIFSQPVVISLSGIVEAPAKGKKYYLYKKQFESLGIWELKKDWLKEKFRGKFIDYGDKRLTEVLKGYVAQAIFFWILGNPFCSTKSCRLYNSHWQKDLIFSQIIKGDFCAKHKKVLSQIKYGG